MRSYERVTYDSGNGRCTIILRDPQEINFMGTPCLTGTECDREGNYVLDHSGVHAATRQHLIQLNLVTRRRPLTMSRHYGTLEVAT